jgi:hypothetical protein
MTTADLAEHLTELLMLTRPPVAVSFHKGTPSTDSDPVEIQPAGGCYWEPAEKGRLAKQPSDHANRSVGSYTHGLINFEAVAAGDDAAALLNSGWVGESDLANAPHLHFRPGMISYEPLVAANQPDVVLLRLSPYALMTLQGACPEIRLVANLSVKSFLLPTPARWLSALAAL